MAWNILYDTIFKKILLKGDHQKQIFSIEIESEQRIFGLKQNS